MIPVVFHMYHETKYWQETTNLYTIPAVGDLLEIVALYNNPCKETLWRVKDIKHHMDIDRTKHTINIHVTSNL